HLEELVRTSENKTHVLFNTVYQRMAVMSRAPLSQLYADLVRYLSTPLDRTWQSPPQGPSLEDSINRFFAKLFPLTMAPRVSGKKGAAPPPRPLNATYEDCLASKIQTEQPFGDAPRAMALRLNDALEGARVLLEAIRFGADVLNTSSTLLIDGDDASPESSCRALLTRLWSCPLCAGHGHALPCQNYCLNVLNGCNSVELARAWSGFVDAAAKLAGAAAASPAYPGRPRSEARDAAYRLNADEAVRQMENKISEAIMYAMENGPAVEKKVSRP
ncbi:Division abnormally delayed protein, partial [Frankliniella fusca]